MYKMGARKIVVANVGPIGCIPSQRALNPSAGDYCVAFPNQLATSYNLNLKTLVAHLTSTLPGSMFVYANVYSVVNNIILDPSSYGSHSPLLLVIVRASPTTSSVISVYNCVFDNGGIQAFIYLVLL